MLTLEHTNVTQECLRTYGFYSEIEYYCSDTCDPNPCPEGVACALEYPACDGSEICPAEAICGGVETMVSQQASIGFSTR